MEEEQIMEQPEARSHSAAAQSEDVGQDAGGSIGKFKDSAALFDAYNNLQSEFTKKCQTLADLKKKSEESLQTDTLNQKLQDFLQTHPEADDFKDMILQQFSDDKSEENSNPFEIAWSKIAMQNFKLPQNLVKDTGFLEQFIFNNNEIKDKILNDYFSQLNFASSPTLISSHAGSAPSVTPRASAKNIVEAGKMAKAIFDGK
ncbi:MAG: hypothetical protein LBN07_02450 [Christensenellaceae bacterium]|jgi:hypothetical protein|nr:hypothetical protein [Christensenellaceae bacterium]